MPAQSSSVLRRASRNPSPNCVAPPAEIRLSVAHERSVYATFAALVVTGCAWLLCHYLLADAGEFGPLPHPLEALWLKLHGAAAMIALVLFGSLLTVHMRRAWSHRRGRATGGMLAGLFVLLTVTGYGLYYVAGESVRAWISVVHWAVGLAVPLLLAAHVYTLRATLRSVRSD